MVHEHEHGPDHGTVHAPTFPRYYIVQAVVQPGGRQVPTFILDANVQGITSVESAEQIARDIITAGWDIGPTVSRNVSMHVEAAG